MAMAKEITAILQRKEKPGGEQSAHGATEKSRLIFWHLEKEPVELL